jgi:prepilin-type N-terminal cleavage/methylation domain-containing protein
VTDGCEPVKNDSGFTLIELLIVVAIIGIIAAIGTAGLLRARMSGNEAAAIGAMRSVNTAQSMYASSCARGGYAQTLDDLAKPATGSSAGFISPDLSANGVVKSGFIHNTGPGAAAAVIVTAAGTCNAAANDAVDSFFAEAHPNTIGSTGQRSFGTDRRGTIFQDQTGATFTAATIAAATNAVQ